MKRAGYLLGILSLFGACNTVGNVAIDPESKVAQLTMYTDDLGALLIKECVDQRGADACGRYPNDNEVEQMIVTIKASGETCATSLKNGEWTQACGSVAVGIPLICHTPPSLKCQQCTDIYGNMVLDNCADRNAQVFQSQANGFNLQKAWLEEPKSGGADTSGPTVTDTGGGAVSSNPPSADITGSCDTAEARKLYAEELNKIFQAEGVGLTYAPDLSKSYNGHLDFWKYNPNGNKDICQYWLTAENTYTQCWSKEPGRCHCMAQSGKQTCKCGRINVFALKAACQLIPKSCDYQGWVGALLMEYGVATQWLFEGTYKQNVSVAYTYIPSNPQSAGGGAGSAAPPTCLQSPLVLDLDGDGISLSSMRKGVKFDLTGAGALQTAWIQGDDALLVYDANGNGVIDNGSELFGEASAFGGFDAEDGFQALTMLDRPNMGGNNNGIIEGGDLLFGELRVWRDANHDGVSQASELQGLAAAGVKSINLRAKDCGPRLDGWGNDLSLRGSYTREDGRAGLIVDVSFANK